MIVTPGILDSSLSMSTPTDEQAVFERTHIVAAHIVSHLLGKARPIIDYLFPLITPSGSALLIGQISQGPAYWMVILDKRSGNDKIGNRKAQARPLAGRLSGEKRFEDASAGGFNGDLTQTLHVHQKDEIGILDRML